MVDDQVRALPLPLILFSELVLLEAVFRLGCCQITN